MTGYMEMAKCNRKQRLLGKSIRRIRMRRNMTQRELANAAGLGESALRSYELGERSQKQNTLERIAETLDVAPACLDTYGIERYDEYNPFVRHAPVKTTEAVFRFFANGYRREHGTEPEVTGNRKLSERDILSGMGAVPTKTDLGKR